MEDIPVPPQAARILGQISTPLPVGRKASNLQDGSPWKILSSFIAQSLPVL